jgi:RsiW-degrading membrane proteinase PrsW (M82 family)
MYLLALAISPGLFLSWYIWWRDKHEREPRAYLMLCFIFGAISIIPAIFLESWGESMGYSAGPDVLKTLIFSVVVVGFSEEFSKYLFLRFYIFPKKEFCEPMDGIVYSVMVSMGFATLENILYVSSGGINTAIVRMFTAVPAHAAFACLMGYFVGVAKFSNNSRSANLLAGLLLAAVVHGFYDFFVFQQLHEALMVFTFVTLILAIIMSRYMIHWHVEKSPYNTRNNT